MSRGYDVTVTVETESDAYRYTFSFPDEKHGQLHGVVRMDFRHAIGDPTPRGFMRVLERFNTDLRELFSSLEHRRRNIPIVGARVQRVGGPELVETVCAIERHADARFTSVKTNIQTDAWQSWADYEYAP